MALIVKQEDFGILRQSERSLHAKIELLSSSFKTIGILDGELISDSYSVDSSSDIRRTYKITLSVSGNSFLVGPDKKIWFDKFVRVSVGIENAISADISWYPIGVFVFDEAEYAFDSVKNELSLSCSDMMAMFTGSRNGQLGGQATVIHAGTSIHDAMVSTVTELGGVSRYRIDSFGGNTVPYDLEFDAGVTVYEIIKSLRDIYTGYETFFDDVTFVCQKYPTYKSDQIALSAADIAPLVISDNTTVDFTAVKNVTEVWGRCWEADYYTDTVVSQMFLNATYKASFSTSVVLEDDVTVGFMADADSVRSQHFYIEGVQASDAIICGLDSGGQISISPGTIKAGKMYVLKYKISGSDRIWLLCGEYQIGAINKLVSAQPSAEEITYDLEHEPTRNISYSVDPGSPFGCDLIGEIRQVLSDGEYADIYSDDLAAQRAKYETWLKTEMLNTIQLSMIDVPWLDVNTKIEYASPNTGTTDVYLIKSKSGSTTGGTMTLSCVKFQPEFYWTN